MGSVTIRRDNPNALNDLVKNLQPGVVRIGWFPSARYDDDKSTPVASIAAQNEYGNPSKNIPARPFIRPAIANNQTKWNDIGRRGLKAVLAKKSTVLAVLQGIGQAGVDDIQHSISLVYSPALKQSTIDARLNRPGRVVPSGRFTKAQARSITKPLIDTGHMQATVSYEIGSGS